MTLNHNDFKSGYTQFFEALTTHGTPFNCILRRSPSNMGDGTLKYSDSGHKLKIPSVLGGS